MRGDSRFVVRPSRPCFCAGALAAGLALAASAQPVSRKQPLAEEVFKNVQVLKAIPVGEFMDTMGFFCASLGSNCVHCYVDESLTHWDKFAEDVPRKRVARQMIQMVNALNKDNFGGARIVTCYSCHHGDVRPENVPSLLSQYSLPVEDPNKVEIVPDAPPDPSADQILDKYVKALGDPQNLTSSIAKGTYEGYDTYEQKVPLEIYAKAPNQRTMIVHTQSGDTTTTFNGRSGWVAAVDKPVTLLPLIPGGETDGARLEADLAFPAHIKSSLSGWRVGFPLTAIDDRPVQSVQGTGAGGTRVKLYFDVESGLLVRTFPLYKYRRWACSHSDRLLRLPGGVWSQDAFSLGRYLDRWAVDYRSERCAGKRSDRRGQVRAAGPSSCSPDQGCTFPDYPLMATENPLNLSEIDYIVVECFHIAGFVLTVGMTAIVDFRLLGVILPKQSPQPLASITSWGMAVGLAVAVFTGFILFSVDPDSYLTNTTFLIKMACLCLAIALNFTIHRRAVLPRGGAPWR